MMIKNSRAALLALTAILAVLTLVTPALADGGVKFQLKVVADDKAAAVQTPPTEVISFTVAKGDDKDKPSDGHPLSMQIVTDATLPVFIDHSVNEQSIKSLVLTALNSDGSTLMVCTFKNVTINAVNVDTSGDNGTRNELDMTFESMEVTTPAAGDKKADAAPAEDHHTTTQTP